MDSTNFYFLQEFIPHPQILDAIQEVDLTEKTVVEILRKLITTSMYLQNFGFQFTDLKPHCIFMSEDMKTLKVTDFDYKCMFDQESYSKNRYGSVYFVSPEVIESKHNDDWLVWN
jgi:serine/threonine protein kinase